MKFFLSKCISYLRCWFFWNIFCLTHFKLMIFFITQTMRLNGCLKEKINVIRPLENFLSDFEKKVSALFEPKVWVNWKEIFRRNTFQNFHQNFFWQTFLSSSASKNFLTHFLNMFWIWKTFSRIRAIQCTLNQTYIIRSKKVMSKKGKQA